jgi:hypothetical protein
LNNTTLPENVEVVAIVTAVNDGRSNFPPSAWFANEGYTGTAVVDNDANAILNSFGVTRFPFWVVVDGNGTVVDRVTGAVTVETLNQMVDSVTSAAK